MPQATTPSAPIFDPPLPAKGQQKSYWQEPAGAALALAIANAAEKNPGLFVVATQDNYAAHRLEAEIGAFARNAPILHFPDWETLPYDRFSPHPDIISQRIATLYRLPKTSSGILIVPITTLMQRIAPRSFIAGTGLALQVGQAFNLVAERRGLEQIGYRHVGQVLEPGDFATRGALLDIFPMGAGEPYRIELFDDVIDTIRTFDPETQRGERKVDRVALLAGREFPLTENEVKNFRAALRERFPIDPKRCPIYQDVREGAAPAGIEYYLPLFFPKTETLFDYIPIGATIILLPQAMQAAEQFWSATAERHEQRRHDIERPILPPGEIFLEPEKLRQSLNSFQRVEILPDAQANDSLDLQAAPPPQLPQAKHEHPTHALKGFVASYPGRVLIATDSPGRRETLLEQFKANGLYPDVLPHWHAFLQSDARLAIMVAAIEDGFEILPDRICVLTERQFLGERALQSRRRKRAVKDPEAIVRDLGELAIGSPVVHIDHGVGRYQGLLKLETGGTLGEFLCIEYARQDKLYVPVAQLDLVSRYTGTAPELAPLHSLGGDAWQRAKRKAAERVKDTAAELLEIYAKRKASHGHAFQIDRDLYEQFATTFPFEETPDQAGAIEAVLGDLAQGKSMDRVVCGDVGFGKTEVAIRAAFVVATAGRQVALLVPTTLLAQQHYQNFKDRFADWPIAVEVLSRFRSKKETEAVAARIREGQVDVVIGTHKLLQGDITFKNLGLVIIDEEHRFGVRHKDQFKKLRAAVDVLTLTATPIPRTLNMAMAGLRDLSIIATPPAHRIAVQTSITPWDGALIKEAFQRELARGGQVYFLHNEVDTIASMARDLQTLLPEARIEIAHGQMPERALEQVMLDFYRQRFNILVCTTIIESGIDVPIANTIIINRADRFGLAQLHQLRGRVGRSHHRAYAYLVVPDRRSMTADAVKRLEAIESLEELGAGFALATHDLEIRGAGELLGDEQSGQIQEVGFTLYTDLLDKAVRAIKEGRMPDFEQDGQHRTEVELRIPALIPDDYLGDVHTRLMLYKRIANADAQEALDELQAEIVDRFGILPDSAKNLFAVSRIKLDAHALGIKKLELAASGGRIVFRPKPNIDPLTIIKLIQNQPKIYALDGQDKLKIKLELPGASERLQTAREIIQKLHGAS